MFHTVENRMWNQSAFQLSRDLQVKLFPRPFLIASSPDPSSWPLIAYSVQKWRQRPGLFNHMNDFNIYQQWHTCSETTMRCSYVHTHTHTHTHTHAHTRTHMHTGEIHTHTLTQERLSFYTPLVLSFLSSPPLVFILLFRLLSFFSLSPHLSFLHLPSLLLSSLPGGSTQMW